MPIDPLSKARHVKLLIHLSKKSGLYPECLILESVQIEGDAVASGSFGEVYRGRLGGQEIAVKILRVFQKSDMEKLLRVIYGSFPRRYEFKIDNVFSGILL